MPARLRDPRRHSGATAGQPAAASQHYRAAPGPQLARTAVASQLYRAAARRRCRPRGDALMATPFDGEAGIRGQRELDVDLLDNPAAIEAADPGQMLRATASAGAQVRESAALAAEANLGAVADEGRPRTLVVAGVGTAARTGDLLATVAGPRCPVPVISQGSAGVPGWVSAGDAVIAVSASGRSPEAIAAADAAARRGARLVAIGAPDSELQSLAERARAPFIPVPRRAPARASLWALTVPVLLAARAFGLVKVNEADLAETATRLDADADRCRPTLESFVNPAKSLALDLGNSIPIRWGSSSLATVAARRFADTLSANARYPAVAGALVEAGRGRVGLLDGVYGGLTEAERDIFADPKEVAEPARLRLDGGPGDFRAEGADAGVSTAGGTKAVVAALLANLGIAATKFVAFALTRSSSMLAETIHSVVDSGNQVLLLVGGRRADREPTPKHPFGYGRERYIYAFIVSVVLFTVGGMFALYEAYHKISHPEPIASWQWVPLIVLVVAIVLESLSFRTAIQEANKIRGKATWKDFIRHARIPELPVILLEDFAALIGLVLALFGT